MSDITIKILLLIVGAALSVVGVLIVANLNSIKDNLMKFKIEMQKDRDELKLSMQKDRAEIREDLARHQERIDAFEKALPLCKLDCTNTFIPTGTFLREVGQSRKQLETLTNIVQKLDGKFDSIQQMPQIAGSIAAQVTENVMKHYRSANP